MPLVMNKTGAAAAMETMINKHDGYFDSELRDGWKGNGNGPRSIVPATVWSEQKKKRVSDDGDESSEGEANIRKSAEIRSQHLNRVIGVVIILNTMMLGLETDLTDANDPPDDRVFWILAESIFIIIFSVEIVLRIEIERRRWPCSLWNWLDVCLVIMAIIDTWILNFIHQNNRLRVVNLLRIVRLIRVVRVVRLVRMFRALYVTVMAFKEALSGLVYICIIMVGGVYVCAIFMTAVVGKTDLSELELGGISGSDRFGTILRSMYSLFELMTLEGWQLVGRPLVQAEPAMALFFFGYIMIFTFGLLNMVVAVVVEKTLLQARRLEKMDTDIQQQEVAKQLDEMREAFVECDQNRDGTIDREEFKKSMMFTQEGVSTNKQGSLAACFENLGIPTDDALTLFDILDADASGELSMNEFIDGCARVLGATDPCWDQLATHALVLGLRKTFQEFEQKMMQKVSPSSEAEPGKSMDSLQAPEDGPRQQPLSASELEEWRRLAARQGDEIRRLVEETKGRTDRNKAALERLQRLEEHVLRSQ